MSINRHNYESYFILYLDNELSVADRRMVEAFVKLHPDLKDELDLLSQFKLTPDEDIIFERKEDLMIPVQPAGQQVSQNELQESLLLYIDGELSVSQKKSVEEIVASNSSAKEELSWLQKSKLEPEEIIFKDKASLYRKEKTRVVFISLRWRIAAAAILLLMIGLTTAIVLNKNSRQPEIVKTSPGKQTVSPVPDKEIVPGQPSPVAENSNESEPQDIAQQKNNRVDDQEIKKTRTLRESIKPVVRQEIPLIAENKQTNNLPDPVENPNVITNKTSADIANNNNSTPNKNALTNVNVTSEKPQPYIIQASHQEDVAIEQPDSKKGKLRGFFRKVTRTFEKRANIETTTDDNKLLVAGLAFKLK